MTRFGADVADLSLLGGPNGGVRRAISARETSAPNRVMERQSLYLRAPPIAVHSGSSSLCGSPLCRSPLISAPAPTDVTTMPTKPLACPLVSLALRGYVGQRTSGKTNTGLAQRQCEGIDSLEAGPRRANGMVLGNPKCPHRAENNE